MDIDSVLFKIGHVLENSAPVLAEIHDGADVIRRRIDVSIGYMLNSMMAYTGAAALVGAIPIDFANFLKV